MSEKVDAVVRSLLEASGAKLEAKEVYEQWKALTRMGSTGNLNPIPAPTTDVPPVPEPEPTKTEKALQLKVDKLFQPMLVDLSGGATDADWEFNEDCDIKVFVGVEVAVDGTEKRVEMVFDIDQAYTQHQLYTGNNSGQRPYFNTHYNDVITRHPHIRPSFIVYSMDQLYDFRTSLIEDLRNLERQRAQAAREYLNPHRHTHGGLGSGLSNGWGNTWGSTDNTLLTTATTSDPTWAHQSILGKPSK